jgi:glycosyltransferase involved in cell wall biosynthesis
MKLLFITHSNYSYPMEAHRVFRYLGDEMQRRGHTVHYFFDRTQARRHPQSFSALGQAIRISPFLSKMCRRKQYDVLICPGALGWCLSTFRNWLLPQHTSVISWQTDFEALAADIPACSSKNDRFYGGMQALRQGLYVWSNRQALETQEGCLVNSQSAVEQLQQRFPAEIHKIAYLPIGVSSQFYFPERYQDPDPPVVCRLLWVGHWHKRAASLGAILGQLLMKHPHIHLSLLNTQQPMEYILRDFPTETHQAITVAPSIDENELVEAYRQHQLFIMPELPNTMPLALLEAMASGMAVVAPQTHDIDPLIHHYENGMLIPPNDTNALEQTISHLIENPGLCHQLGESAYETVSRYYTWQQVGDLFEGHLSRLTQLASLHPPPTQTPSDKPPNA